MSIDKLVRILKANGWKKSPNVPNGWYRGLASLFFSTDNEGLSIIKLSNNDWGYISMIHKVTSTTKCLDIIWKSMESWRIIY